MKKIVCIGRDSVSRLFQYRIEHNHVGRYTFFVYPVPQIEDGRFSEIGFVEVSEDKVKSVLMESYGQQEFQAVGIPDTMILEAAHALGKKVISSSNKNKGHNEWRSDSATKVWERLRSRGSAIYHDDSDTYHLI